MQNIEISFLVSYQGEWKRDCNKHEDLVKYYKKPKVQLKN